MQSRCQLVSEEDGIKTYNTNIDRNGVMITFSVIKIDGKYYLHHPSKPSWTLMHNGEYEYEFYVHGIKSLIENLPCDEEMKCILALKYVYDGDGDYL